MAGGQLVPGTYVLSAMDKYNGTQGSTTRRETWVLSAGHLELVSQDGANGAVTHYSGSFTTSTNTMTIVITCPTGGGTLTTQYNVSANQIQTLSEPSSSDQEVHTLTLVQ